VTEASESSDPTAQARDLPLDSHLHTNLSPDSRVPIDAYATQALERGIAEICITDHVDFEPGTPAYDFVPFDVRERTVREAAERWAPQGVAIRSGLFDTIGHLDFVKRYLIPHVTPTDLAAAPELYEPLLEALVETGTALEVNTSGLRQAPRETYPSESVVRRFGVLGGTGLSAGSDAHDERAFASGLEAGYRVALAAGARDLAFRRGGERVVVALPARFRQPARPNEATVPSL